MRGAGLMTLAMGLLALLCTLCPQSFAGNKNNAHISCPQIAARLAQNLNNSPKNIETVRLSSLNASNNFLASFPHSSMPFELTGFVPATKLPQEIKIIADTPWPIMRYQDPYENLNISINAAGDAFIKVDKPTRPYQEILLDIPSDWTLRESARAHDLSYNLRITRDLEHSPQVIVAQEPRLVMSLPNAPKVEAFPLKAGPEWLKGQAKIDEQVLRHYLEKGILTLDEINELTASSARSTVMAQLARFEIRHKGTQELAGTLGLYDGSRSPGFLIAPEAAFDARAIASTNPIQSERLFPFLNLRSSHPDAFELGRYAVPSPDIRVHRALHTETSQFLLRKYGYNMQELDKIPIYDLTVKANPRLLTRPVERGGFGFSKVETDRELKLQSGKVLYLYSTSASNYIRAVNQMLSSHMSKTDVTMWDEAIEELIQSLGLPNFPVGR